MHTHTAFAACLKFTNRLRSGPGPQKAMVVRAFDEGSVRAVELKPWRLGARALYAPAKPAPIALPGTYREVLLTLDDEELPRQVRYLWNRLALRRWCPLAEPGTWGARRRNGSLRKHVRIAIANAIDLAIARPEIAPLTERELHPSELDSAAIAFGAGDAGARPASARKRELETLAAVHESVPRPLLGALLDAAGPELTGPPATLALIRAFCESYGVDPETLTWAELRALWIGGAQGLEACRVDGRDPVPRFRDRDG
ncbi:MAG: hypothetical protein OXC08_20830 [Thiotrichales bacterium]|nr:hypothetical protein [Thiotrichales bacterium]